MGSGKEGSREPYSAIIVMKCFTENECSEWLRERAIVEKPYSRNKSEENRDYYFQFEPPVKTRHLVAFTQNLFLAFGEFPGALLVFNDWNTYPPNAMAVIDSLRRGHGDLRPLIEAPGHWFAASEQAEAIGHSYLAVTFGWSAYLYLATGKATVLFWEGDLVDFWSADRTLVESVGTLIQNYGLRRTGDRGI